MKRLIVLLGILIGCTTLGYAPLVGESGMQAYKKELRTYENRINGLLHAFKIAESNGNYRAVGLSGEYGAYQFLPDTWKMYCRKTIGQNLDILIPANQDKIARHKVLQLIQAGYTDEEIASIWNCGSSRYKNRVGINKYGVKYDVPAYVVKIIKLAKLYRNGSGNLG